jgi:hypothetical protein
VSCDLQLSEDGVHCSGTRCAAAHLWGLLMLMHCLTSHCSRQYE